VIIPQPAASRRLSLDIALQLYRRSRLRIIGLQVRALPGAMQVLELIEGQFERLKAPLFAESDHTKVTLKSTRRFEN
jgi:hypothetical protein